MKKKKAFISLLLATSIFCLTACSVERYNQDELFGDRWSMTNSIFEDEKFRHRFGLKGISTAITGQRVLGEAKWKGARANHAWTLSEWDSKHLFLNEMFEEIENGTVVFSNEAKKVTIEPGKGKIILATDARKEYGTRPREDGEGWLHLLLEQAVPREKQIMVDQMEKLNAELEFCISKCDLHMTPDEFKPGTHSAQISWYFTLEFCKGKVFDIEGRPDYLWFGLPIYDYRYNKIQGPQVFLDHGTQKVIYGMNRGDYLPEPIEIGTHYKFKLDILSELKKAFDIAKQQGWLAGAEWKDMAIGSMNIGWEIPGIFDCEFQIDKMSLTYEKNVENK